MVDLTPLESLRAHTGKIPASSPEMDKLLNKVVKYQEWLRNLPEAERKAIEDEAINCIAEECSQLTD